MCKYGTDIYEGGSLEKTESLQSLQLAAMMKNDLEKHMNEEARLPNSNEVNVSTLGRIFSNTTNSYKYLFFLSLLNYIERNFFAEKISCSVSELTVDMLAIAWYPHTYFKLNFGTQDQVHKILSDIKLNYVETVSPQHYEMVRAALGDRVSREELARYVPYRLIRPFFELETRGLKDDKVNARVAELSREYVASVNPLYHFSDDEQNIIISPSWLKYLKSNLQIVRGWALWRWLGYMQKLNPSVPNVAAKLLPPFKRSPLTSQEKFWRRVLEETGGVRCIYTGGVLTLQDFSLDHFLPWSFVAHDELWNMIPTAKSTNSSKSDFLPAAEYLLPFAQAQHAALVISKDRCTPREWTLTIESYLRDLRISEGELLDGDALAAAYQHTMGPLIQLATANGFVAGWRNTK